MSVAVLKLEDETLFAVNLNHVSKMILSPEGLYFEMEGISYATYSSSDRRIRLHRSIKCEKGESKSFSAEAMFDKFCNL